MTTQTVNALVGGAGGTNLLPSRTAAEIWDKARSNTIIPALAKDTPIILGDNHFPVVTKKPTASIVGEGGPKIQSELEVGAKTIRPIKTVVGLEFTMEAILSNPAGILGLMTEQLSAALAEQIDLAVMHGKDATSGSRIAGAEYLEQTTQRVNITTAKSVDAALWEGYGQIVNAGGHDFTGFALDPRYVYELANDRDKNGVRVNDIAIGGAVTSYAGQPVAVAKSVSGQLEGLPDTGVRGFGGDWNALKFGYNLNIPVKRIEYGDPFGNGDLQARNSVAYMAEVIFGWAILDKDSFVAYEVGAPAPGGD